jgi:hypothetical protein
MTFLAAALGAAAGYGIAGTAAGALMGAGIGASIGSSRQQAKAVEKAAQTQYAGTQYAADVQRELGKEALGFQREVYEKGLELGKGYRDVGGEALTRISELMPSLTSPVTREEIMGLPGYQFAMQQGTGAARQGMNVGAPGSNVDRAAQKFAIDYTMGTAMPQVIAQRQNIYNTLAGIAGLGQTGTGQAISSGQQFGQGTGNILTSMAGNIGQTAIGGATALAGGQIGAANVMAAPFQNLGNAAMMYSLMKA